MRPMVGSQGRRSVITASGQQGQAFLGSHTMYRKKVSRGVTSHMQHMLYELSAGVGTHQA